MSATNPQTGGMVEFDEPDPHESGGSVNDAVMDSIRARYEVLDRIIKNPQYDGKAVKSEAWQAFREIQHLRRKVHKGIMVATSAELVAELYSRITAYPPTSGTING